MMDSYTAGDVVDLDAYASAEVEHLSPGHKNEDYLNTHYGPGNPIYDDLCSLIRSGIRNDEGWCATIPIDGEKYRRNKIALPSPETIIFSITTVYMESKDPYLGQYHQHPYGEINCIVQLDETAQIMGMQGWQGAGWTSPGVWTHHYPEIRGGALVALFFLPAGRISYEAKPGMPQPESL